MSETTEGVAAPRAKGPWREAWSVFRRNKAALLGLVVLLVIVIGAVAGPWLYPVDPFDIIGAPKTAPGTDADAPFGTDYLGRDILAGIVHGGRPTLMVGFFAAMITTLIGITMGAFGGFYGGRVDAALGRITEFFQVLPALLFAMVLVMLFAPSLVTVTIAIGVVAWTSMARLTRAEFLRIKQLEFVDAVRCLGMREWEILATEVVPNAVAPVLAAGTLVVAQAILLEASLSFLGLSSADIISWGRMLNAGQRFLFNAWWMSVFPGLAICLTVLAVNLLGDAVGSALNPRTITR